MALRRRLCKRIFNANVKKKLNGFTIATINTLFDGISVENRSIGSWIALHAKIFAKRKKCIQREQHLRDGKHPVEQIIQKYQPEVLVMNEVIYAPWGSETKSLLDKYNYAYRIIGLPKKLKKSLARNTLIASKLPGKSVNIPISNFAGGHFCALRIKNSDVLILGIHASAFAPKIRSQQIKEVFEFSKQKIQDGLQVVVAGDFNYELPQDKGIQIPMGLLNYTKPSFPHPNLLKKINLLPRISQKLLQSLLSLSNGGQRSINHILIPSNWTMLNFCSEVTSSDHSGLIAKINFRILS